MGRVINLSVIALTILASLLLAFPAQTYADSNGIKIGDTQVLTGGYVSTCVGFTSGGQPEWQVDLGTPQYLDDKTTKIDTQWYLENGVYVSGANKFTATAQANELINVQSGNLSISWKPTVSISNIGDNEYGYVNEVVNSSVKVSILPVDPINSNYHNNTLQFDYGNGLYHRIRLIEGMCLEYYVITNPINGDYNIAPNIDKPLMLSGLSGISNLGQPIAYDTKGKQIPIATDDNYNITLHNETDAAYPIYIDPDLTFETSSSDGDVYYEAAASWNNAWSNSTGSVESSGTISYTQVRSAYAPGVYYRIYRSFLYFNTATIPAGVTITAASLKLYGAYKAADFGAWTLQVQNGMPTYPHDPLVSGDYAQGDYAGNGGQLAYSSMVTGAYNTLNLNATGIGWINTSGYTKFCLRELEHDINDSDPGAPFGAIQNNLFGYYSYEEGAGYRPELIVTYTALAPSITAVATSSILPTTAQLNSSVTSDGYDACAVRFGYGTTSHTAADFNLYTTITSWSAYSYHTGDTPYYSAMSLTGNTTYYFRVQIINSAANSTSTNELSFTTLSPVPLITAITASSIAKTSAQLNSLVTWDGGDNCQVRFGYGTTSETAGNFNSYDTVTSWSTSYYNISGTPYYSASSLTGATTYYFRVQIKNTTNNSTSTNEISFTTVNAIGDITGLQGISTSDTISLSWGKASGSTNTLVRVRQDIYPTSVSDGTQIYFNALSTYDYSGLTAGKTYYFAAWGESGGTYSTDATYLVMTTLPASLIGSTISTPSAIAGWSNEPTATGFSLLEPFYSILNNDFSSMGTPQEYGWLGLYMVATFIVGMAIFLKSHSATGGAAIVFVMLIVGSAIHLLPFYIAFIYGGVAIGIWQLKSVFGN